MLFKKIIYLRYFPLTERIYHDLYFPDLLASGFDVEYVDLKALFFPDQQMEEYTEFKSVVKVFSYKQFEQYLKAQSGDILFISIMTYEDRVVKLYKLLTKHHCKLAVFARGVFPIVPINNQSNLLLNQPVQNKLEKLLSTVKKQKSVKSLALFPYRIIKNKLFNNTAIALKTKGIIKPYDFVFTAGFEGIRGLGHGYEIDQCIAQTINVNTVDYDTFLSQNKEATLISEPYCVFLDQCLPYHPDAQAFGIKTLNPDTYYSELNRFFNQLENLYKVKIIIAAHPKAHIYKQVNPFQNRTFLFNETCRLVKHATFVISHSSTSICFPIMFNKPILFINSPEIKQVLPNHYALINHLSDLLKCNMVYYDHPLTQKNELSYNPEAYSNYRYRYLTSVQTENDLSKVVFLNFLKRK